VQALKNDKDPVLILGQNADAIVAHSDHPFFALSFRGNSDGARLFPAKLDSVANQVLEELY